MWRKVTRDVAPIDKTGAPSLPVAENFSDLLSKKDLLSSSAGPVLPAAQSEFADKVVDSQKRLRIVDETRNQTPAYGGGDPRRDRLVSRRRLPIERTLDLHGLTQAAAEPRVYRFLQGAHRDGCRCVLIITGKGAPAALRDAASQDGDGFFARRGVLRERLKAWIDDPRVRALVSRMSPARQRDGGDGAFYVFLKKA